MVTMSPFKSIENKHGVYRSKDSMKKFSYTVEIIFLFFLKKKEGVINKSTTEII